MLYLLLFHCNNCYTNALQCYVIRTLLILFDLVALSKYTLCTKSPIPIFNVHHMITKAARNRQSSENCSLTQMCLCTVNPRRKRLHWVLFCDESTCQVLGHVNRHNVKTFGTENPRTTHEHIHGNPKLNASCGLVHNSLVSPSFFYGKTFTWDVYLDLLVIELQSFFTFQN